jgi:hypothetical protein
VAIVAACARDRYKVSPCPVCKVKKKRIREISLKWEAKTPEGDAERTRLMAEVARCMECRVVRK